ncbi:flavin reductase family protein [Nocardioides jensenii]|uniref:flavin reductase family protein n=1 Tax=Nocardioides jensenii TaxID=1843 RepID=UPI000830C555|nr:flavin reductase family protein [Nocardioides jensenii]
MTASAITMTSHLDVTELRHAFSCFPSGLAALCSLDGGVPIGIVASSFTSVSLDPPLVSVCIQKSSRTWPALRSRSSLGISVLAAGHDSVASSLAAREGDRFKDVPWYVDGVDAVLIDGSVATFECIAHSEFDAGDHIIAVFEVLTHSWDLQREPLVFHHSKFRTLHVQNPRPTGHLTNRSNRS